MVGKLFEFLSTQRSASIDVVGQRFDIDWCFSIGRQNLFQSLATVDESEDGFRRGHDIDLVLVPKDLGKVLQQGIIEIPSSKVSVVGR